MVILGMFAGVLAGGYVFGLARNLFVSRGPLTLPQLLHIPDGVAVCAIVFLALLAFRGAEWLERQRVISDRRNA
jgi:hypothetical protein